MMHRFIVLLFASLSLISCKNWHAKPKTQSEASPASDEAPKLVQKGDAYGANPTEAGFSFEIDDRGRPKLHLVVRLDYFPDPKPGKTSLPSCLAPLPVSFELGLVSCADKPELTMKLEAKAVEQDCYTSPRGSRVASTQPLLMPGCKVGRLLAHQFNPPLRVFLESKDVN